MDVSFRAMRPEDVLSLVVQPSQAIGLAGPVRTIEHGEQLARSGPSWTAIDGDGRLLCCAGFGETFEGRQAVAWALLADPIGAAHIAITRFARAQFVASPLRRIEAIVRADLPQCAQWARLVGMRLACELPAWGVQSELHYLFERVR